MDSYQEILAIIKTCQITGVEVKLSLVDGKTLNGRIKDTASNDNIILIEDVSSHTLINVPVSEISNIEYFGNIYNA